MVPLDAAAREAAAIAAQGPDATAGQAGVAAREEAVIVARGELVNVEIAAGIAAMMDANIPNAQCTVPHRDPFKFSPPTKAAPIPPLSPLHRPTSATPRMSAVFR
jgi:hypothetical protein